MTRIRDLVELLRVPAALTVPGDVLVGAAATGRPHGWRPAVRAAASVCLYWAGMALNDYADREIDARERPERPIPSGRIRPTTALRLSGGLTAAGLALAAATGRRGLGVAAPLAATVWAYDLVAKESVYGPVVMGTARFLDVLLGAAAAPRRGVTHALAIGTHTTAVTALSRGEVHGSSAATARAALGTTVALAAAVATATPRNADSGKLARIAAIGLTGIYVTTVGRAQVAAATNPDAATVRRATGTGIHGLVPLQAALLARRGSLVVAGVVAGVVPLLRAAAKKVSST